MSNWAVRSGGAWPSAASAWSMAALGWAQLGYHAMPVGLLNSFGFYDRLIEFWDHMGEVGFVRPMHTGLLIHDADLDGLIDKMAAFEPATPITAIDVDDL